MNKTLLGILCLHICLLIGLSQSRQARMDSEWKSKRSIGARDGGQQKFPSPEVDENVDDPCPSGRDGGQQKFPSPDPCNRKKRSGIVSDNDPTSLETGLDISLTKKAAELNPYNRMGNLQKRLNPHHRMAPNFDKKSIDDDAIIIEVKRDNSNLFRPLPKDPEEEGTIVEVKRLNPNNRMASGFGKRSAQAEWQTNTNPLFRPLNENTEDGTNDSTGIVSVKRSAQGIGKRSAQAEWQTNTNPLFRPLNENTEDGTNDSPGIVSVKRSAQADWQDLPDVFRPLPTSESPIKTEKKEDKYISPHNRMANINQFNRMGNIEKRLNPHNRMAPKFDKRSNDCASNSPDVEYDESLLSECCNIWFPTTPDRSGRVKDVVVYRACSKYLL